MYGVNENFKKMEKIINNFIDSANLVVGDGYDPLFIQIMDKNAFGDNLSEEDINIKMNMQCRKIMSDNKMLCLFTHAYIKDNQVICFGVTMGKDEDDYEINDDAPKFFDDKKKK